MIQFFLTLFFSVVFVIAAIMATAHFWRWFYWAPTEEDEVSYCRTDDGRRLAVLRYRPEGEPVGLPVILCHGLSSNRFTFDLPGAPSLARFLRDQGRDVWVSELRGSGASDRPRLWASGMPYSWDFEDHLRRDVPAVVAHVTQRTQAPAVHWVGHSMGGMLIRAYLAGNDASGIQSAVTLGSPVDWSQMQNPWYKLALRAARLLHYFPVLPLPFLVKIMVPFAHRIPNFFLAVYHPPNIEPEVSKRVMALATELVTASKLWGDFGRFLETGVFGPNGHEGYLDPSHDTEVPILILAGARDEMAPPEAVAPERRSTGSPGKPQTEILGKDTGCAEDYGHMDLVVGKRVEQEVFPSILRWIGSHDCEVADSSVGMHTRERADT